MKNKGKMQKCDCKIKKNVYLLIMDFFDNFILNETQRLLNGCGNDRR